MFVALLVDIHKEDLDEVGGKGANLGELYDSGLPVPPGFVITTAGYRHFVETNHLQEQIVALAAKPQTANPAAYEAASTQIRDLFVAGSMPDDLADAICAAYDEMASEFTEDKDTAVAVRSSATAEDLPQASFAGQQETFLNVRGEEALLDAIRQCWASLWTARAIAYRQRMGIDHASVAMGVVIQMMVPSVVSGVLFTANPTTGARDELVVNASFGLGQAIVAGEVTPDTYVLDRDSMKPKKTTLGTKDVMIVAADGQSTTAQTVPEAQRSKPALSEPLLAELASLGLRVEQHFDGAPQDIEWAVANGRPWLLQSRPITNLPPAPLRDVRWQPPRPGTVWMRRQIVEHIPEPLSPLFEELYLEEGLGQSFNEMADFIGDLANMEIDVWDFIDPPFATTVNGYAYTIASFSFSWRLVPTILRMYTVALPRMIRHMVPYWRGQALPNYLSTIERWKAIDLNSTSDEELLQGVRELAAADAIHWFGAAVPLGMARMSDALLDRFLKSVAGRRDGASGPRPTSGPYLRGFPSKALEAQAELEAIARQIRGSDALRQWVVATPAARLLNVLAEHRDGQPVLDDLQRHLDQFGHQIYNLDFAVPTQADDPLPVLLSLKAAVENPARDVRAHQEKLAREREALVERTEQSLNPLQRRLFRLLLNWAQRYAPYREEALFYLGAAWPALRKLALELGRRLTRAGSLEAADDVFFLKSEELMAASTSRAHGHGRPGLAQLAQERRELREARKRLDPPVSVPPNATLQFGPIRMTMFEPQPGQASVGPILNGFAVSPGRVTAAASVIHSPDDFDKMAPDTILVCTTTTPAWTPLFAQAKGLVTDIGGALAHGSIVAREYGIPAVMGTGVATQRIQSGQQLQVDGDAGTVTLVDEADAAAQSQLWLQPPAETRTTSNVQRWALLALAMGMVVGLAVWWKRRRQRLDG